MARQINLGVHGPDFNLIPATSVIEIGPGHSVSDVITIDRLRGSAGDIQFAASGLPPDVTATFAPNPAGGDSTTLTLRATINPPTYYSSMTVTATPLVPGAGSVTRETKLDVQVRPDFTVKLEGPTKVNLTYGSSITVPVTITRELAFLAPPINLSVTGLPAVVTASFDTPTVGAPSDGGLANHVKLTLTAQRLPGLNFLPANFVLDVQAKNGLETSHASLTVHGSAPFDLVWNAVDDNGIPKNPEWFWQVIHPGLAPDPNELSYPGNSLTDNDPKFTTQDTSVDYATGWNDFISSFGDTPYGRYHGHVNWQTATYEGNISWEAHSSTR